MTDTTTRKARSLSPEACHLLEKLSAERDRNGLVDVVITHDNYAACRELLMHGWLLWMSGRFDGKMAVQVLRPLRVARRTTETAR